MRANAGCVGSDTKGHISAARSRAARIWAATAISHWPKVIGTQTVLQVTLRLTYLCPFGCR